MTESLSPESRQEVLSRALVSLRQMKAQLAAAEKRLREPVAIIGLGCRFPGGADTPERFWNLLIEGKDAIGPIPPDRWNLDAYYHVDPHQRGKMYTRYGAFLENIQEMDAAFFGISPREAAALDPQQRLLLEVSWEALEHASIPFRQLEESQTGVYVGITSNDYGQLQLQYNSDRLDAHFLTGNVSAFASGRLSYLLGLQGPSLAIDTTCSSSLVAIHTACAAIRAGECDQALAGGVNVILLPDWNVVLSRAKMMAPDGRCKTFDQTADGYVRGEGCGMLVLKKLARARRDGDRVLAVIRGSAVNSDGRAAGITVPNGKAQVNLLRQALERAGCKPNQIDFIEAHGTGTALGDPIELRALASVFSGRDSQSRPLHIASVKTNFGHLEPAAGVAATIKTCLALEHETIPPHLHLRTPNPGLNLGEIPAVIPTEPTPWPRREQAPRLAGVSSFGASGTNAHLILEEAPDLEPRHVAPDRAAHLLTLSARDPETLSELAKRYSSHLETHPHQPFGDVAFTANRGRKTFEHRLAVVAENNTEAAHVLKSHAEGVPSPWVKTNQTMPGATPKTCFLFTGQGSQYAGMGHELYLKYPLFRATIDRCEEILAPSLPAPLTRIMFNPEREALLNDAPYTQTALFSLEYALAQLWISWGIEPAAVVGHSLGEYTAACIAGVFDLEEGLLLVADRAELMSQLPERGAMIAVLAEADKVTEILADLAGRCGIAALNGPQNTVVSGLHADIRKLEERLLSQRIRFKSLKVTHGFHSEQMDPMLDAFEKRIAHCRLNPANIPIINNVTGRVEERDFVCRPAYWRRQTREPVHFEKSIGSALDLGISVFLEIGPAPALIGMGRRLAKGRAQWLPSLTKGKDDFHTLCKSLGTLYTLGSVPNWEAFEAPFERRRVSLPNYPFRRQRFWMEFPLSRKAAKPESHHGVSPSLGQHPLLGQKLSSPLATLQYETNLDPEKLNLLREFRIEGLSVVNIGVYVEMAMAAFKDLVGREQGAVLDELVIFQPLILDASGPRKVQLLLEPKGRIVRLSIQSQDRDGASCWHPLVRADVRLESSSKNTWEPFASVVDRCRICAPQPGAEFYENLALRNIHLGSSGKWIERIWRADGEALCQMRRPSPRERAQPFSLQPGLVDAACQLLYALLPQAADPSNVYMLVGWRHFEFISCGSTPAWCHAKLVANRTGVQGLGGNIFLWSESGKPIAAIHGARIQKADPGRLSGETGKRSANPSEDLKALLQAGSPGPEARTQPVSVDPATMSPARRVALIASLLVKHAASVLGFLVSEINTKQSLHDLGMDSLLALELKGRMDEALNRPIPLVHFLEGHSLEALAHSLAAETGSAQTETQTRAESPDLPELPWGSTRLPAIEPDPERAQRPFGLTDMQQAYWVGRSENFELGSVPTFFTMEVDVYDLDLERLNQSWNQLIQRHGMLRAVFLPDGRQKVLDRVPTYFIQEIDLSGLDPDPRQRILAEVGNHLAEEVLDTASWPLFDIRVCRQDPRKVRVHFGMDALIVDAWSTMILFREWAAFYRDPAWEAPKLDLGFSDYMRGLEMVRKTRVYQASKDYWRQRLSSLPSAPQLPTLAVPDHQAPRFLNRPGRLEPQAWRRFKERAKKARVTPSMAICAAYAEVLAAWSKSRHFTLDLLFFNRLPVHSQVKNVVANFSSTLLLEVDFRGQASFLERALALQTQLGRDLEHSLVSGVEVLREFNRRRGGSRTAVMPVVFASTLNLHTHETAEAPLNLVQQLISMGNGGEQVSSTLRTPQVWLDHQAMEDAGGFVFNWAGVDEIFPPNLLDEMFAVYHGLLDRLAEDEAFWRCPLRIGMVPETQLAVRNQANETRWSYPNQLLHQGFRETVRRAPHRVAIVTDSQTLTYGALADTAARRAVQLRAEGVRPNQLVAVVMRKHWQQAAATLSILEAGAAYLPINPDWPQNRIHYLLHHGFVEHVLTLTPDSAHLEWPETVKPVLMDDPPVTKSRPAIRGNSTRINDLAYVIYTSGSTGKPKGVAIEHGAAVNTLLDINRRFNIGARDIAFGITSLTFDLSVYDFFGLFAAGGALALPQSRDLHEPMAWLRFITRHRVTIWNSVPALMELLVDGAKAQHWPLPNSLRLIMLSGDWIAVSLPDKIREHLTQAQIISLGGATEAAVWSIFHPIGTVAPDCRSIPYGKPLANQQFHVLDSLMEPCPVWVPGELFIAGKGLARSYWRDAAKTSAAFLIHARNGERLYRTGDWGRYLPDGAIEFLGRDDSQVKIQGYRVELGEIETALNQIEGVRRGVVLALGERQGVKTLVAYVVPALPGALDVDRLKGKLAGTLPEYMVPAHFIELAQMPLTPNGKVDRKALPKPGSTQARKRETVKPRTSLERELVAIWERLLDRNGIGVTDNFFELGGHSFLAMKLMAQIFARFKRQLPLATLFSTGTVAGLAHLLDAGKPAMAWSPLVPIRPEGTRTPFFCVHPVGGNVLCYRELARGLAQDRPFYGLQARGLAPGQDALGGLGSMADLYLESVRKQAENGPVILGGWSMGGNIAFEMAVRLRELGQAVPLVVLIDSFPPNLAPSDGQPSIEEPGADDEVALWRGFLNDLGRTSGKKVHISGVDLQALSASVRLERVLAIIQEQGWVSQDFGPTDLQRYWNVYRLHSQALAQSRPGRFDGKCLEIYAAPDPQTQKKLESGSPWSEFCLGTTVHYLKGDHYSLLRPPSATALAQLLDSAFARTAPSRSTY